jgi:hypothetical protein
MADVYIYQAALLCSDCGETVIKELTADGEAPANPEDESSFDSDEFPKGPYPDGGGEADSPQHCDHCGTFLYNPLTGDGYAYLRAQVEQAGAIVIAGDDIDEIDIEATAAKAQADWDCTRRHGGSEDEDAPLAQWIRYYPEAWHPANMR